MPIRRLGVAGLRLVLAALAPAGAAAQLPLGAPPSSGQLVYPVFEGWYKNPDGSFSISFGYFNRNSEEVLEIPVGPDNFITPGDPNQGQPARFETRRHWGVFAVKVPANFGSGQVLWTVKVRGETIAVPGSLHPNWQIDALEGEAGSGNTPPVLKLDARGPEASGPGGITVGPLTAKVGVPLVVTLWARDDGKASSTVTGARKAAAPVTLMWLKHQGPGKVTFANVSPAVSPARWQGDDDRHVRRPGRLRTARAGERRVRCRERRPRAMLLDEWIREGHRGSLSDPERWRSHHGTPRPEPPASSTRPRQRAGRARGSRVRRTVRVRAGA